MAHTPGPWNATGAPQVWAADGSKIAVASNAANARIIAAAPELLAVCEAVVGWPNHHALTQEQIGTMARAALAKAKGE